jgi:hypothetical protein
MRRPARPAGIRQQRRRRTAPQGRTRELALLALSRSDRRALPSASGRFVYWLILVVVLISAANATVRKLFNYSSNAYWKSSGTCSR